MWSARTTGGRDPNKSSKREQEEEKGSPTCGKAADSPRARPCWWRPGARLFQGSTAG